MAKGKVGPRPEMKVESEMGVTVIEEPFLDDPTAEEIVGKENIVDVGTVDDTGEALAQGGYVCWHCKFATVDLSKLEEHAAETGHGRAPVAEVQPELFSTPGIIHKMIDVPMEEEFLNQKKTALAELYQNTLDVKSQKKAADAGFNAKLTACDERMQEISRILANPFTSVRVDCEWRILEGENARGLYRLDTNEQIETSPLTQEDRVAELNKASEDNAPAMQICKVCGEDATVQLDGDNQFTCDKHHLEGDVIRRLK